MKLYKVEISEISMLKNSDVYGPRLGHLNVTDSMKLSKFETLLKIKKRE